MKPANKWLLLGVVSVGFGVFALGNTVVASLAVTTLTGALFLLSGGFQIVGSIMGHEGTGSKIVNIAIGALMAFLGLSFLINPLEGIISLAMLVLLLLLATGVLRIVLSWRMRNTRFFWPMLISGALSVLLGGYIWANFAAVGPQLLGILLGIELLLNGLGLIALSFFVRAARK
ncbi:DUF308 domain-containing protein [Oceaniglobus trochenteri]|uniref:DUF308 domain-containing protein n=1 Tax=Oceaniglobus trochenteri TaxID=2763260 RepID=UPI001CFFF191|nr:DUF308 domain-containing protein [Oceaniglobus trochenteri]